MWETFIRSLVQHPFEGQLAANDCQIAYSTDWLTDLQLDPEKMSIVKKIN